MKLIDLSLRDYNKEVFGESPAPGGGSVSAYAGSLGASLTQMVGSLTIDKKAFESLTDAEKAEMKKIQAEYEPLRKELEEIVDTDATSFDEVMAAFKLPKETDEEKKARSAAIQEGYKKALEIPLKAAELCLKGLEMQDIYAHKGNKNAITDVGVGTLLLQAGLEGALFNVLINVNSIKDEAYANNIRERAADLLKKSKEKKEETLKVVYEKLK